MRSEGYWETCQQAGREQLPRTYAARPELFESSEHLWQTGGFTMVIGKEFEPGHHYMLTEDYDGHGSVAVFQYLNDDDEGSPIYIGNNIKLALALMGLRCGSHICWVDDSTCADCGGK